MTQSSFGLRTHEPALLLAPMEGVTDAPMRAFQAERGAFTHLVSEFIRVSQNVLSKRSFLTDVPELRHGSQTASGHWVQVQLLGGHPERIARSAQVAVAAGAPGIDLNFGCPAPTVNRHDGGATLLLYPDRIQEIVSTVRAALPAQIPVSAKLRLGWDDLGSIHLNAEKAAFGGASWVTIHGRTKVQGYMPPIYWGPIGEVRRRLSIPVVANGDIWTLEDFKRCRDQTDCLHYMLGRGALADPALPGAVARELGIKQSSRVVGDTDFSVDPFAVHLTPFKGDRARWWPAICRFIELSHNLAPTHPGTIVRRIKQWIRMAHTQTPLDWWEPLKKAETLSQVEAVFTGVSGLTCVASARPSIPLTAI